MSPQLRYYYRHKKEVNKKTYARQKLRYNTDLEYRKKINEYHKIYNTKQGNKKVKDGKSNREKTS